MKKIFQFVLTSVFFLTVISLKSQDADTLKAFINKNNTALRSVQKNSMKSSDPKNAETVKELLKQHLISIKLFETNKALSYSAAYKLRESAVGFLSKNSTGSIEYFKVTDQETKMYDPKLALQSADTYLSQDELKSIDQIDTKDPRLFNAFNTIIK